MRTAVIISGYLMATAINSDIVNFDYPLASFIYIGAGTVIAFVTDVADLRAKLIR